MWPLTPRSKREQLQGIKTIRVNGHKFKIRKVNPFQDFPADRMPQIFSYAIKRRKLDVENLPLNDAQIRRGIEDMKAVVTAGVIEPRLCPEILTVDDLFRWGDTGSKLYLEILAHSLNQFRGLTGVFFSIKIRRSLYTAWQKSTVEHLSS